MSRQVTISAYCAGKHVAPSADIQRIALRQSLFSHHALELTAPFDRVEGNMATFFSQAHKQLLGQPFTLQVQADSFHFNRGQSLLFKGVVTRLETGRDNDYTGSFVLRSHSPCYLLASGLKKRTFVGQTLEAIFTKVLEPFPANLLPRKLNPRHKTPLPYVAQYQETNFDFLSRLATEYGEWFYYDGQTLVLGPPPTGDEVDFVADGAYNGFAFGMGIKPAQATLYEYNYQKHEHFQSQTSQHELPGLQGHPFGAFALQESDKLFPDVAHVPAETPIQGLSQLDDEARAYKAHAVADLITLEGYSDNPSLRLGGVVHVRGEGLGSRTVAPESFGKYRIIELVHHVDYKGNYSNQFTAIPYVLDVPPIHPHYDAPHGTPELAEVIDDKDPEKLGRLKVRYYWPVRQKQDAETDWIRLLTPYSGHGKGQLFKPEVGSQVLVGYQSGLAEQPFVLGNLFHANNRQKARYSPASNGLKGLQTAGGNKFVMNEAAGAQSILISNSNKKGTSILVSFEQDGSISLTSNGPINLTSGDTITMEAKKNIVLRAGADIEVMAQKNVLVGTQNESIALQAQKELLLKAVSDDLTLEAAGKKLVAKSADDVEITASGVIKNTGSDIKWSKP